MNQRKISMRVIPALLACMASGYVAASGFQLTEQNASGLGNAYAGSAAVADNASTIFFNPAGMTQLQAREASFGVTAIQPTFKFNNGNSSVGNFANAGDDNGGTLGFVPNGYLSWAVSKDLYLGLGIGAPFGLMTEYKTPWVGAAQSIKFDVKTLNINPSIAYRVNDTVSLGFGVDYQKIKAEYKRLATTGLIPTGVPAPAAVDASTLTALMKLDDDTWGWNVGALFTVSPATKIGVSYRSAIKYKATGNISLSSDGSAAGGLALAVLTAGGRASNVSADIKLPDTWIFSATHKLNNQWELLGDLSHTGWSSIPKIDIVRTSGVANGAVAQTLDTNFRDTWRVAMGANYAMRDDLKLKMGVAYDQTPTKNADYRLVSMPDNDRLWLSFGAQWQFSKASKLDVGATYLYIKDAPINNNQLASARGLVNGTYKDSAWILGAQYSMAF
jgi:long-chain fatty acid transport protein